jgi:hypothetical protein
MILSDPLAVDTTDAVQQCPRSCPTPQLLSVLRMPLQSKEPHARLWILEQPYLRVPRAMPIAILPKYLSPRLGVPSGRIEMLHKGASLPQGRTVSTQLDTSFSSLPPTLQAASSCMAALAAPGLPKSRTEDCFAANFCDHYPSAECAANTACSTVSVHVMLRWRRW